MSMSVPGQQSATELASKNAPWKKGVKWWVMLIEGVLLFVLGLYVVALANQAANAFIYLISLYLLLNGVLRAARASRETTPGRSHQLALVHGIAAIVVSVVVIIIMLTTDTSTTGDFQTPGTILGWGILIIGVLSLLSAFLFRDGAPIDKAALVSGGVLIVFAIVIFMMLAGTIPFTTIGWIALILGIILIVTAYGRYNSAKEAAAKEAADAKEAAALDKAATAAVANVTTPAAAPAAAAPAAAAPAAAAPAAPPPAPAAPAPAPASEPPPAVSADAPSEPTTE